MRSRLLDLCLRAYPRDLRARDGAHLRELATDLAADHGVLREALGLLRGGLAERRRHGRVRRTVVAVVAATALILTALTWTATAQGEREEELFTCTGQCPDLDAEVAARVADGWTCTELSDSGALGWRCTRD